MFKKIMTTSIMLAIVSPLAFANPIPYVGGGIGIINNSSSSYPFGQQVNAGRPVQTFTQPANFRGVPFNLFVGYGGVINQNFYLAGEFFGTVGTAELNFNTGLKTSYGYGASIIPGLMLSDHTLAFLRGGVVRTRFSNVSTQTGGQIGIGLQTNVTQNIDVRGEYIYSGYGSFNNSFGSIASIQSDAFNVGVIYKFD